MLPSSCTFSVLISWMDTNCIDRIGKFHLKHLQKASTGYESYPIWDFGTYWFYSAALFPVFSVVVKKKREGRKDKYCIGNRSSSQHNNKLKRPWFHEKSLNGPLIGHFFSYGKRSSSEAFKELTLARWTISWIMRPLKYHWHLCQMALFESSEKLFRENWCFVFLQVPVPILLELPCWVDLYGSSGRLMCSHWLLSASVIFSSNREADLCLFSSKEGKLGGAFVCQGVGRERCGMGVFYVPIMTILCFR